MWMVSVAIIAAIQFGCSKKNGLSPDDTALIKGTDRGTFVGSGEDGSLADEGELSPLGTAITGLDGSDGLLPQDPFWDEPGRMDNPERPSNPSSLALISTTSELRRARQTPGRRRLFILQPRRQDSHRRLLRLEGDSCVQQIIGRPAGGKRQKLPN